jgi:hypothetical protein
MNKKGITFLLITILILFLTIYVSKNNNHFFVRHRDIVNFEESMFLQNTLMVLKETDVFIESFKDSEDMNIFVNISDGNREYYTNNTGVQEEPFILHLEKGTYQLSVDGKKGKGEKFDLRIYYYTDHVHFLNEGN